MTLIVQLFVNGIAMGMIYALMAMGLILLIRAIGVMNFAQGDLLMLGAFITWALTNQLKLPFYAMVPAAMISFALFGIIFMFLVYWPLRNASYPTATVISTMGASMVIKELATLIWGSQPLTAAAGCPSTTTRCRCWPTGACAVTAAATGAWAGNEEGGAGRSGPSASRRATGRVSARPGEAAASGAGAGIAAASRRSPGRGWAPTGRGGTPTPRARPSRSPT